MIEGGHGGQELIETIAAVGVVVGGGVFTVIAFLTNPARRGPGATEPARRSGSGGRAGDPAVHRPDRGHALGRRGGHPSRGRPTALRGDRRPRGRVRRVGRVSGLVGAARPGRSHRPPDPRRDRGQRRDHRGLGMDPDRRAADRRVCGRPGAGRVPGRGTAPPSRSCSSGSWSSPGQGWMARSSAGRGRDPRRRSPWSPSWGSSSC